MMAFPLRFSIILPRLLPRKSFQSFSASFLNFSLPIRDAGVLLCSLFPCRGNISICHFFVLPNATGNSQELKAAAVLLIEDERLPTLLMLDRSTQSPTTVLFSAVVAAFTASFRMNC